VTESCKYCGSETKCAFADTLACRTCENRLEDVADDAKKGREHNHAWCHMCDECSACEDLLDEFEGMPRPSTEFDDVAHSDGAAADDCECEWCSRGEGNA